MDLVLWLLGGAASAVTVLGGSVALVRYVHRRKQRLMEGDLASVPRKLRAQVRHLREHLEFELIPLDFEVRLKDPIPRLEVSFRAVNYTSRPITGLQVSISSMHIDRCAPIEGLSSDDEGDIRPKSSRPVRARKSLIDSEVRALSEIPLGTHTEANIMFTGRGFKGRKPVKFQSSLPHIVAGHLVE